MTEESELDSLLYISQTGTLAHPSFYAMGTGALSLEVKKARP
jgi:hypothetical protein